MPEDPPVLKTPRKALADQLADREAVEAAAAAAAVLTPEEVAVRFVTRLLPGMVPAASTVAEFVRHLRATGWQVLLPGLEAPQAGDLYVMPPDNLGPADIGFVGPLLLGGQEFTAVTGDGDRQRLRLEAPICFLRLPCAACDQAAALPRGTAPARPGSSGGRPAGPCGPRRG